MVIELYFFPEASHDDRAEMPDVHLVCYRIQTVSNLVSVK